MATAPAAISTVGTPTRKNRFRRISFRMVTISCVLKNGYFNPFFKMLRAGKAAL